LEKPENNLETHLDEVMGVLGDSAERDKVLESMKKLMERFPELSMFEVKKIVIKKFGGNPWELRKSGGGVEKKLSELGGNETSVNVIGKILKIWDKVVEIDGRSRKIFHGIMTDNTATMRFTAWDENFNYKAGDVIRVINAYTRRWRGNVELNIGERAVIVKEDDSALPAPVAGKRVKLRDLRAGMSGVCTKFRVLSLGERRIKVNGEEKVVFSGIAGDETGKVLLSVWADMGINEGDVVLVEDAYVTSWKGIPQINIDVGMPLEVLTEDLSVAQNRVRLGWVEDVGGAADAVVEGFIVDIKRGSGIIRRCPVCDRVISENKCPVHGSVDGVLDMRIKAVIDDGTGCATLVLGRELTEKIVGIRLEQCTSIDNCEKIVEDRVRGLFATELRVRGNITKDEFGLMLVASDAEIMAGGCEKEAREVLSRLGVVL